MALIQQVKDGKFIDETTGTGSTSTKSSEKDKKTNELGYDQFLQILCAEMQYQDPLEPTSNTEYIAQLATFSQLESQLSVQSTIEASSANDLADGSHRLRIRRWASRSQGLSGLPGGRFAARAAFRSGTASKAHPLLEGAPSCGRSAPASFRSRCGAGSPPDLQSGRLRRPCGYRVSWP